MDMTESVSKWLDGDSANSFFEFKLAQWGDGNNDPMKGDPPWFDSLVCTLLNKLCSDAVANSFATFKISSCSTSSSQLLLLTFSCFILFSFSLLPSQGIELMATKSYHPSGVITVTVVFQNTIYVTVLEGDKENPLLDSRFPDVSGKGSSKPYNTPDQHT